MKEVKDAVEAIEGGEGSLVKLKTQESDQYISMPLVLEDTVVVPSLDGNTIALETFDFTGKRVGDVNTVKFDSFNRKPTVEMFTSTRGFILVNFTSETFWIIKPDGTKKQLLCSFDLPTASTVKLLAKDALIQENTSSSIMIDSGRAYLTAARVGLTEEDEEYLVVNCMVLKSDKIPSGTSCFLVPVAMTDTTTVYRRTDALEDGNGPVLFAVNNNELSVVNAPGCSAVTAMGGVELIRNLRGKHYSTFIPVGDICDVANGKNDRLDKILSTDRTEIGGWINNLPFATTESKVFHPAANIKNHIFYPGSEGWLPQCPVVTQRSWYLAGDTHTIVITPFNNEMLQQEIAAIVKGD